MSRKIVIFDVSISVFQLKNCEDEEWKLYVSSVLQYLSVLKMVSPTLKLSVIAVLENESSWLLTEREEHISFEDLYQKLVLFIEASKKEEYSMNTNLSKPLLRSLCFLNRSDHSSNDDTNILIITCSPDCESFYIATMHSAFIAQKMNVNIDSCCIWNSSFCLSQASKITRGVYNEISSLTDVSYFLNTTFTSDSSVRAELVAYNVDSSENKMPCNCHFLFHSKGYLCSICMKFYCELIDSCTSCKK